MRRRTWHRSLLVAILGLLPACVLASAAAGDAGALTIPGPLKPWVDWVLHDQDERACPVGNGEGDRLCAWPGHLQLTLDGSGGRFAQIWEIYAEAWVPLPGDSGAWPQQVSVDAEPMAVVAHEGRPALRLQPGRHQVAGRFEWPRRPEVLTLPDETGLLTLSLDGAVVERPRRDAGGRLWLGKRAAPAVAGKPDSLALDVVRRIDDDVPLRVQTRLALDVAGQARELTLAAVTLPGGVPLRLDSPLPARLIEQEGAAGETLWALQVQLRPGRWTLTLESHHAGPVRALTLGTHPRPWPTQEVWAFAARPNLREVEVGGADLIDPRQTRLPDEWRRLPAYLMVQGDTLSLTQLRRGSAGSDRLTLDRELRLDFGGDGFSVRDRIVGELQQRWRLAARPALRLGQVSVDGEPRMITRVDGNGVSALEGVEVRRDRIDLSADGRFDGGPAGITVSLPASGWELTLDGIDTRLHLPPGWELLAVDGVDNLPDSWLARWSLLDIFMVLVIALGIGRLWGWRWGLLALLALVLTWSEPGAPRWIWVNVLVAAALIQVLPTNATGKAFRTLRALVAIYYRGALLVLAVIALPFLVGQVRDGLFPQLERSLAFAPQEFRAGGSPPLALEKALPAPSPASAESRRVSRVVEDAAPASADRIAERLPALMPGALVQTGNGVPTWAWRGIDLSWNGPVAPDERFRLWLLPPVSVLPIALLQVVLVMALGLRLADRLRSRASAAGHPASTGTAVLILAGASLLPMSHGGARAETDSPVSGDRGQAVSALAAHPTAAAERARLAPEAQPGPGMADVFPPARLLDELRRRLLEPPECLPGCVEIPRMVVDASADQLRLLLAVDAAFASALPLPGSAAGWLPTELSLNGEPFEVVASGDDGTLLAAVPAGRHLLLLSAPLPQRDQVELPLPLRPRLIEARVMAPWQLQGVDANGHPGDQLRIVRRRAAGAEAEPVSDAAEALPAFLRITRTLRLGLDWTLETRVERLSPDAAPVSIWVPLIAGEAVTSAGMQVEDGRLLVSLPPGRRQLRWESALTPVDRLTLSAGDDPRLVEVWKVAASPIWHLAWNGVPAVRQPDGGRWPPTWRPWPGERLELQLSRPAPVPGPTLTLDGSDYRLQPGRRVTQATLELELRSSQGGRHSIRLPDGVELTRVSIDGQPRPLSIQGGELALPLVPGSQRIELGWRASAGLTSVFQPERVDLSIPGVNAQTQVQLGRDRWLLWTSGPGIGPAVQFWGLLLVLAAASALLARSRMTPLGFSSWLLLGIGLSQAGVWAGAVVVLWLFALGWRRRLGPETPTLWFNLTQVGLVALSAAALLALVSAVQQGLLGDPAMQIAGNGSSATQLNWYLDRQGPELEPVTLVSAPIWVYRCLMLAWALWLAWRLLEWLRWGWRGFAEPSLWRQGRPKTARDRDPARRGAATGSQVQSQDLTVDI